MAKGREMILTRKTPIHMLTLKGESHKVLAINKELLATIGEWEKYCSPGKGTATGYSILNSPGNIHTSNTIYTEQVVFTKLGIHTHTPQ